MGHQVGDSGLHQIDTDSKLGASAGSEATQQKSHGKPRSVATLLVPEDLCGGVGSQGVIRMRPSEFIRLK